MEQTYIMIKPGFANYPNIIKEIKHRINTLGLTISTEHFVKYSLSASQKHYDVHKGKPFFDALCDYMSSDKAYGMIVQGENAIAKMRGIIGSTIKKDSNGNLILPAKGTIRRDIPEMINQKCDITKNVIHSSDSVANAKHEINIFLSLPVLQESDSLSNNI